MCGRVDQGAPAIKWLRNLAKQAQKAFSFMGSESIFPGQELAILRLNPESGAREALVTRWGLVPSWARDAKIGRQCYNARSETVHQKPAFKSAFMKRRCLVPVQGFYEYTAVETGPGGSIAPGIRLAGSKPAASHAPSLLYIQRKDEQPFCLAGMWEENDGLNILSSTVVTTTPNELISPHHNRMPVILDEKDFGAWLDLKEERPDTLLPLLKPYPAGLLSLDIRLKGEAVSGQGELELG